MSPLVVATCNVQACGVCGLCRQQPQTQVFTVGESTAAKIASEAAAIVARRFPATENEKLLVAEAIYRAIKEFAPDFLRVVSSLLQPGGPAIISVKGLPVPKDRAVAEVLSIAFGLCLGDPFQFLQQNFGKLAAVVAPAANAKPNSNASSKDFGFHTDDALIPPEYRTRWISLYGLVNACRAATGYVQVELLLPLLGALADILRQLRFEFRAPASFGIGDVWSEPRPVLWDDEDGTPCITFTTYSTRPVDPNDRPAVEAISRLTSLLERFAHYTVIGPGDYVVFANDRGLHNRTAIAGDRLVLRSYWRKDLSALRAKTKTSGYVFDVTKLI